MEVKPAHIDQLQRSESGEWAIISADTGGVAADLQAIDKSLKVRLNERNGVFVVYSHRVDSNGMVHDDLVLTHQGERNSFGVWEGLHSGITERVRQIDRLGTSGYDYAKEIETQNAAAHTRRRKAFAEKVGPIGELAAAAIRKDLGVRYKGRAFKP